MSVITRTSFCPYCYNLGYPRTGDKFVVLGGTSRTFYLGTVTRTKLRGFTPHLFIYQGLRAGKCKVLSYCCMIGCDTEISNNKPVFIGKEVLYMDVPNWNALVFNIDKSFQI